MVAVAAQVAKAATTTAVVGTIEGLPAVINIAKASIPPVVESTGAVAAIPAATEVMGGATKAVEIGIKTTEVAPEAAQAASKLDLAVKKGAEAPVEAMRELVVSPVTNAERVALDADWAEQKFTEIVPTVQPKIAEWEKTHLPGNDVQGWIEQRAVVEKQFTVDEAVNRDLEEWKMKNPAPDKETDGAKYADWEKQLAVETNRSRKTNGDAYEQFLQAQAEKNQGMSKQEFMRKYARLLQLRAITDKYAMSLQTLRASSYKTAGQKDTLVQGEAQLASQRAEITMLEAELQFDAVKSGSIWKQYIIPAAIGLAMVAGPMSTAANEI